MAYNREMPDLTSRQVDALLKRIAAVRQALDDFERVLVEPDSAGPTRLQLTPEVKSLLERVPKDEVERLSDVVPNLGEIKKDRKKPRKR